MVREWYSANFESVKAGDHVRRACWIGVEYDRNLTIDDEIVVAPRSECDYSLEMVILAFFLLHWQLAVFFQSFFLHRYGAHKQFSMSKRWERFFHLSTYLTQGASYLSPRGYAILHRMHHAYSDTVKDPHSPSNFTNVVTMMLSTKHTYDLYAYRREQPEARFLGGYPEWEAVDSLGQSWVMRILWGVFYTSFYIVFATHWWMFLLLPFHFIMGPIHGAIVNWCGHRYGYRNFDNGDLSRNSLIVDFVTAGELFQNNHHKFPMSPSFAVRRFEIDPTYAVMRMLAWLNIIDIRRGQRIRWSPPSPAVAPSEASAK